MRAIQNIRTEMRENCLSLGRPATATQSAARITRTAHLRQQANDDSDEPHPHIDPWMEAAFEGLIHASETGDPFALVPCFMNGKPAAIIAAMRSFGRKLHVTPAVRRLPAVDAVQRGPGRRWRGGRRRPRPRRHRQPARTTVGSGHRARRSGLILQGGGFRLCCSTRVASPATPGTTIGPEGRANVRRAVGENDGQRRTGRGGGGMWRIVARKAGTSALMGFVKTLGFPRLTAEAVFVQCPRGRLAGSMADRRFSRRVHQTWRTL